MEIVLEKWFLFQFLCLVGELLEWLKRHAWKVCIPQKGIEGSNPSLSAKKIENIFVYLKKFILLASILRNF